MIAAIGVVGLAVVIAAIAASWRRWMSYKPQHGHPIPADRPATGAAGPPWPPAGPPAAQEDRLWLMAARFAAEPSERLTAPRVAAGRLTRTEVIRTYFELADRPAVAALTAYGWPTGYPLAFASEVTHL